MIYRDLKDWEKERYARMKTVHTDQLELLLWEKENKERALNKGLEIAFKQARAKTESELKQIEQHILETEVALKDCIDKLEHGVPVKEDKTDG